MSQYPSFPPGDPGFTNIPNYYNGPAASPRPGSVTGLAITGIVMGSLGLICRGIGAASAGMMVANGGKNPFMAAAPAMGNHTFQLVNLAAAVVDLVFWLVLLVASVAALSLKPLARRTLLLWSPAMIVWQIIWFILQWTVVMPATLNMLNQLQASQPPTAPRIQMNGVMQGAMIGGYIFWLIVLCVLPVLFLSMWNRPRVKAAFGGAGAAGPGTPGQYPSNYSGQ